MAPLESVFLIGPSCISLVRVILNHRPRNQDQILDHVVMSDLISHCLDYAHYPSTVPHVISSAAELIYLHSFSLKERVGRHSELARDKTRQTGHGSKDSLRLRSRSSHNAQHSTSSCARICACVACVACVACACARIIIIFLTLVCVHVKVHKYEHQHYMYIYTSANSPVNGDYNNLSTNSTVILQESRGSH